MEIRALTPDDADACDAIILSLPYHFGSPQGRDECAEAVRSQDGLIAREDDEVVGFLTWIRHFGEAAEITWMGVRGDRRRQGIGRALVDRLADDLRSEGRRVLLVTTLSPNDPDDTPEPPDGYQTTRSFYEGAGFLPLRDVPGYWGPGSDLALLMVKQL